MQQTDSQLFVSIVSLWEIQIKLQIGKLTLQNSLADVVSRQQAENGMSLLPISLTHVLALENLHQHHKDPFDRLLIAQCMSEAATLVSRDSVFKLYGCPLLW
jgi:PIN domain nuclease of toxin-antitoxin system